MSGATKNFDVETRERLRFAVEHEVTLGKAEGEVFSFEGNNLVIAYAKHLLTFLDGKLPAARSYISPAPAVCDLDESHKIADEFYDSRLVTGTAWANMCPDCWRKYGAGLGTGYGQHYRRRPGGTFVKVGG